MGGRGRVVGWLTRRARRRSGSLTQDLGFFAGGADSEDGGDGSLQVDGLCHRLRGREGSGGRLEFVEGGVEGLHLLQPVGRSLRKTVAFRANGRVAEEP